jgi:serpin B
MRLVKILISWCAVLAMNQDMMAVSQAEPAREPPSAEMAKTVQAANRFAVDLYGQLNKEQPDENLFFSPASISIALGMTAAGARGQTQSEMARAQHLDDDLPNAHAAYHKLLQQWNAAGQKRAYELRVANRLWGQSGYPIRPEFQALTREQYGSEMVSLDFAQSQSARAEINHWVDQQTRGKIDDLIAAGTLDGTTRLVLTNAVYFKGDWEHPFEKKATQEQDFTVSAWRKVKTPLMHQTESLRYAEDETVQILEMPYAGGELSMLLLLPKKADGLSALSASLSLERLDGLLAQLRERQVISFIPKFKLEASFAMKPTLEALGMKLAFSRDADLSGISARDALFISAVIHKAFVDVNEEGTEAAAATGEDVKPTAVRQTQPAAVFRADHPFLFAIRDRKSRTLLFLGRVIDPTR